MFKAIQNLFKQLANDTSLPGAVDTQEFELSMAALLGEVASADSSINEKKARLKCINFHYYLVSTKIEQANYWQLPSKTVKNLYQFMSSRQSFEMLNTSKGMCL